MTAPPHAKEHDELMVFLAKLVEKSDLIDGAILITVGKDGRPCIGGNIESPAHMLEILRQLVEAEDLIEAVKDVPVPRDN